MFWQFFLISVGLTVLFVFVTGPGLWSSGKDKDKKPDEDKQPGDDKKPGGDGK